MKKGGQDDSDDERYGMKMMERTATKMTRMTVKKSMLRKTARLIPVKRNSVGATSRAAAGTAERATAVTRRRCRHGPGPYKSHPASTTMPSFYSYGYMHTAKPFLQRLTRADISPSPSPRTKHALDDVTGRGDRVDDGTDKGAGSDKPRDSRTGDCDGHKCDLRVARAREATAQTQTHS